MRSCGYYNEEEEESLTTTVSEDCGYSVETAFYCVPLVRHSNRSIVLSGDRITFIRAIWTG